MLTHLKEPNKIVLWQCVRHLCRIKTRGTLLSAVVKRRPKSERREWEEQVRIGEERRRRRRRRRLWPRRAISGTNRALLRGREAASEAAGEVAASRTAQMTSCQNSVSLRRREERQKPREAHM